MHLHLNEILAHIIPEALRMLPFLFGAYLFMEYLEHKAPDGLQNLLTHHKGSGVVIGSLLGCVPQCGFSVAASNLYAGGVISAGTLLAVFLSTSDEALMVMLGHPDRWNEIFRLLGCKILLAVLVGLLVDKLLHRSHEHHIHDLCEHCGCHESEGILRPALRHTLQVFIFILVVMFLLEAGIHALGEERLASVLLTDSFLQPIVAALVGFIPNCAVSVALTELYLAGSISFGSAVAGLATGAGMGLMVLWRTHRDAKENLKLMAIMFVAGSLCGILLQLVM